MINHQFYKKLPNWLLITAAVFITLFFIAFLSAWLLSFRYENLIAPRVKLADLNLGGKSLNEARDILQPRFIQFDSGLEVIFRDKKIILGQVVSPELSLVLFTLNPEATLENLWSIGHNESELKNIYEQVSALIFGRRLDASLTVDREAIKAILQKEFFNFEMAAQDAGVEFKDNNFTILKEVSGLELNYDQAVDELINNLAQLNNQPITINSQVIEPKIYEEDIRARLEEISNFFDFSKTKLVYEKKSWDLTPDLARHWVGLIKDDSQTKIVLRQDKISKWLEDNVSQKINQEMTEPRLTISAGKVSVWQPGQDGLEVDLIATAEAIANWPTSQPDEIEVRIKKISSQTEDKTAIAMGLKEIIGTGISNFAGSPANRRHNIKVGANSLHGLLIKPGEEFSLLKALGEISGRTGYLTELVIKENKTIPEYGGGLCQIGTTMFRATFNSGLPVTQRRNHSYRVVYYEPAGTDATIYDPAPDYRFINDTGNYVLIQARINGNELAFDFWGTKDGRQIEFTKPVIYNIIRPAATKIIETTDLKEGEKKCTESSHNGADAYFDYKVTYPNGEVKEKRFTSHYVPWQAVCLVGVKELTNPEAPLPITGTVTPSVSPATN